MKNLHQILEYYADKYPNKVAIRFLARGEEETDSLTYLQLKQQAQYFATQMLKKCKKEDAALLVFETNIDVVIAFWGCVYAGIIAVPIPVPNSSKDIDTVIHIINDANINIIISHDLIKNILYKKFQKNNELKSIDWFLVNRNNIEIEDSFKTQIYSSDNILLLQYTSGSTSKPKGVKISHKNIISNQEALKNVFYTDEEAVIVSWLPYHHIMGLAGKIIHATYCGGTLIFMAPLNFIQKPLRWLKAISIYKATNSAAPNFGFEESIRNIDEKELSTLDLSSWKIAWNAAEPVHASTLIRFQNKFSKYGFNPKCLSILYGMSEASLGMTVSDIKSKLKLLALDDEEFKEGKIKVIEELSLNNSIEKIEKHQKIAVDCGICIPNHEIKIVSPTTYQNFNNYEVGEVWFNGPSVAYGYLGKEELSKDTFYANINNDDKKKDYLRTGDLGFIDEDNHLYIVGRNKDMLIVHGENYAPQDLEYCVINSNNAFVHNGCTAFSVMAEEEERVVIVSEIKHDYIYRVDYEQLLFKAKEVLAEEFKLQLYALVLITQGTLPKTSSGKVQRSLTRTLFLENKLDSVYSWLSQKLDADQLLSEIVENSESKNHNLTNQLSYESLIQWLELWIKKSVPSISHFDESNNFSSYGMDSKITALMTLDLESFIGYELNPTLCWNYPNPEILVNHLINEIEANKLVSLKGK
ncbi:hypothetical protein CRV00_05735 [Malaciobacter molluscorum]|uniref:AMP-binding protein n=1 Tax=Malaciobacter molluscorum TaxID=1032072 RepID=UPI00100C2354|nr:AMP-binding protein [Malaciobacter molluscorum]RXJ94832.1 hypothetical protein CRV00_05735 [Malaciobacter molluscorum]